MKKKFMMFFFRHCKREKKDFFRVGKMKTAGPKERFWRNMRALEILKNTDEDLEESERHSLADYVGWGGLEKAFGDSEEWAKENKALRQTLTDTEYEDAKRTVNDAFFTDLRVTDAIMQTIRRFGFYEGNLLEPSMGVGNFFSVMKEDPKVHRFGVEIDPLTGKIAQLLYPNSKISICGFQETTFSDNFFDVAVGNVPFGEYVPYDKKYEKLHLKIHDYFLAKTLDLVRPGGIMAFITAKGTMDRKNTSFRSYLSKRAVLIGAVRLPDCVFWENAGTRVTSDVLFLQKKEVPLEEDASWVRVVENEDGILVNQYFVEHPDMLLGNMVIDERFSGSTTKCVNPDFQFEDLENALHKLNADLITANKKEKDNDTGIPAIEGVKNYSFTEVDGKIYYRENSTMKPVEKLSGSDLRRVHALINIRKTLLDLLQADRDGNSSVAEEKRKHLNQVYDQFVRNYGFITDRKNMSVFHEDADCQLLAALEVVDENETVKKADIFRMCTSSRKEFPEHVDTALDGLQVSLNRYGYVNLRYIADLYGKSMDEIFRELQGMIFQNPEKYKETDEFSGWETADEYLSGNVKEKLKIAEDAEQDYPGRFSLNVEMLKKVQPEPLSAADISVQIGTTWISNSDYEEFMYEKFGTEVRLRNGSGYGKKICVLRDENDQSYFISNKALDKYSVSASQKYGTSRMDAYSILEATLNLRTVTVRDRIDHPDGSHTYVVNQPETILAREKQELIKSEFSDWLFSDDIRRRFYVDFYNDTFNNMRSRTYDGGFLTFPGMNPNITLTEIQKNSVARILFGGNTLLALCVGAGKSFIMIASCMEKRRLGLAKKPMIVVPKPLIQQMAGEFMRLYPSARILVPSEKDFSKQNRKRFLSKTATGDYDCVILSHEQFGKIPISPERQKRMIDQQIRVTMDTIDKIKSENGEQWTIKKAEAFKKSLEERSKQLSDLKRDDTIYFEEMGIDCIMVDEAHNFKNCAVFSKINNVSGISSSGSKKAYDMLLKCQYLNEITEEHGVVFSTATPISNSLCEMFVMQQYLQPSALKARGIEHFDAWAANFGEVTTSLEMTVDGGGYRFKSRFNRFKNVPELLQIYHQIAEVRSKKDLNLDLPVLRTGNYIIDQSIPDEYSKKIMEDFVRRAEIIHNGGVDSSVDNFLKITNEARLLGIDARLLRADAPENPDGKLLHVASNICKEYTQAKESGIIGCQLVFSDLGTPKKDARFTVYGFLKDTLVQMGYPEDEIAFVHDAKTDQQRMKLFRKVQKGEITVLIGSTDKCGTGVNIQDHLIALHHIECPWKPAHIEQREGRIIRQGNQNKEVAVYRYVTKGTFDAYSWSTVERKQRFIHQVESCNLASRTCEDIDEATLSYAEIKAVASENPLVREKMELDNDIQKLKVLKSSFNRTKFELQDKCMVKYPNSIAQAQVYLAGLESDIAMVQGRKAEEFRATLDNRVYEERKKAGLHILERGKEVRVGKSLRIGNISGLDIAIRRNAFGILELLLVGANTYAFESSSNPVGLIVKMENQIDRLPDLVGKTTDRIQRLERDLEIAKQELEKPFDREFELEEKLQKVAKINASLDLDFKKEKAVAS